ncbi:alpha/beta-hydrolase [Calocera cornea HHB12733]|uniref:Alpha/beta-hydrolase n=1 Tax=Calocera cornea HHB12733 TaxID=1353952 RepID=A0A165DNS5_9BASI|nr:alpha/beta-hydrolase [Calocera cornea HHB12733]
MTSPTVTSLSPPLALLRRLLTALSSLSLSPSAHATQHHHHQPHEGAPARSVWQSLGWETVHNALALRWPWRADLLEQVDTSSSSDAPPPPSMRLPRPSASPPPPPSGPGREQPQPQPQRPRPTHVPNTPLYQLYFHPALFDPIRTPRLPIVLCHGLYGFDVRGPSSIPALQMHYWAGVLKVLRGKVGAEVVCPGVPGTGSIEQRAQKMDAFLREQLPGKDVNFVAHSMVRFLHSPSTAASGRLTAPQGGLDCRHLITHIRPEAYTPRSLLTISTPHRGSAVMDWFTANIGVGTPLPDMPVPPPPAVPFSLKSPLLTRAPGPASAKLTLTLAALPSSLTSLLLSAIDSPAYANLTTAYLQHAFNPRTPDAPGVKYFSVAGRAGPLSILHPLWLPKLIMDAAAARDPDPDGDGDGGNDGLVSVKSARWGEFLGTLEDCDHWEMRGARGLVRAWELWGKGDERQARAKGRPSPAAEEAAAQLSQQAGRAAHPQRAREPAEQAEQQRSALSRVLSQRRGERLRRAPEAGAEAEAEARRLEREERGAVERFSGVVQWMTELAPGRVRLRSAGAGAGSGAGGWEGGGGRAEEEPLRLSVSPDSSQPSYPSEPSHSSHLGPAARTDGPAAQARNLREKEEWKRFPAFDLERFYLALSRKLYDEGL